MVSLSVAADVISTEFDTTDETPSADIVAILLAVIPSGVVPAANRTLRLKDPIDPAATTGEKFTVRRFHDAVIPVTGAAYDALIYWRFAGITSVITIFIQSSVGDTEPLHHQVIS
jgi:hypothetical protein